MGLPGWIEVTTPLTQEFTCLVCRYTFAAQVLDPSAFVSYFRRATDFRQETVGTQRLAFQLVTCPRCGFTAKPPAFTDPDDMLQVDFQCRQFVWNTIQPQLAASPLAPSLQYEFAARIAVVQGRDPEVVGDLWLRAAWCTIEEQDQGAERYYRIQAVHAYMEALKQFDMVVPERRALLTYLVGELWRRIGFEGLAKVWFLNVAGEVNDPEQQDWLIRAAETQLTNPREWL